MPGHVREGKAVRAELEAKTHFKQKLPLANVIFLGRYLPKHLMRSHTHLPRSYLGACPLWAWQERLVFSKK